MRCAVVFAQRICVNLRLVVCSRSLKAMLNIYKKNLTKRPELLASSRRRRVKLGVWWASAPAIMSLLISEEAVRVGADFNCLCANFKKILYTIVFDVI